MFPFAIKAYETPNFTSSAYEFRTAFLQAKPEKLSWYAYDVCVLSPTMVEFTVYDMRDSFYGGKGEATAAFEARVGRDVTRKAIEREAERLAIVRRQHELEAAEHAIIADYATEILEAALGEGTGI